MTKPATIAPADGLISEADFARVASLLHDFTGIDLKPSKRSMASVRLSRLLKANGATDTGDYLSRLQNGATGQEREAFVEALTTNVTRFNREAHQFGHLARDILPGLAEKLHRGGRVRLWSAGCSTGEEAYDLAFRVLDACPDATKLDCRILATDIDRKVLHQAGTGHYSENDLSDLSPDHLSRHFSAAQSEGATPGVKAGRSVRGAARDLVVFRQLNLHADWPFAGQFDVIMCRNVTIYFDAQTQARLWRRFTERLAPSGALYIGHSETIPPDIALAYRTEGASIFRKIPARAADAAAGTDTGTNTGTNTGTDIIRPNAAPSPQARHDHEHQGKTAHSGG